MQGWPGDKPHCAPRRPGRRPTSTGLSTSLPRSLH